MIKTANTINRKSHGHNVHGKSPQGHQRRETGKGGSMCFSFPAPKSVEVENIIRKIEEIVREVEVEWRASDGGGTWASGDVLYTARQMIKCILGGEAREVWKLDPCSSSTGAEAEIIDIAQQWAVNEIKRQIEDRVDKDEKFFEQVINLL